MIKRILFIMLDQMRRDHLSCYGHPAIQTPHIDALAARGVRFERAYVQGTSCGNSRASYYTGRHVRSHGATWNDVPFDLGEWTLADYMKTCGLPTVLLGKTHMRPDSAGLDRLGIDPASELGRYLGSAGFPVGERHDGLYGTGPDGNFQQDEPRYHGWLREHGFGGANPWQDWANAVDGDQGEILSANFMQHAGRPARLPAAFSETTYLTDRAIDFIDGSGEDGWCLHLSYIKPHWPYVAPDPYHAKYGPQDILPVVRNDAQLRDPHPVYQAFMQSRWSTVWNKPLARETVLPAYMGMIAQIDDQIGRLTGHLAERGLLDSTLIALTADHGDYLGDHWLGEKDLFHDASSRVPLIIVDPRPEADVTRGKVNDELVAAIDLLPTFIEAAGADVALHAHRLEGASLQPWLHASDPVGWREAVFSECDYARLPVLQTLGRGLSEGRLTMAFDGRYKYVHCLGFGPMLFDLLEDPNELVDRARDPSLATVVARMKDQMLDWSAGLKNRTAFSDQQLRDTVGKSARRGILIGFWSEDEPSPAHRLAPPDPAARKRTPPGAPS